ncbi:MAG TPA: hypothetical protein VL860_05875 [Planctomycetota bacterium]|nr:hypothetical protein [Planctomycetota bacterium]
MSAKDGSQQAGPYQHCALCPAAAFPRLAQLPDAGRRVVHPVALVPAAPASAGGVQTAPAGARDAAGASMENRLAEAVLLFWSRDRALEASLAGFEGIRLFDWTGGAYRERRAEAAAQRADGAGSNADAMRAGGLDHLLFSAESPPALAGAPELGFIPQPMLIAFEEIAGVCECQPGAGIPLCERLRLPPVRTSAAGRGSGGFTPAGGTPARGVSVPKPTLTPVAGTRIPSPITGIPLAAASGLVGLRMVRGPAPTVAVSDDAPGNAEAPGTLDRSLSGALLLGLDRRDEILAWIGSAPPTRTQGLAFAMLPDALWIDRLTPGAAELPPWLGAERLSAHAGSIGSTLWLRSGAAWSPPLAADILLDRLGATPHNDYVLQPDPHGGLRCRYVIDRNRLLPFERATVRAVLAGLVRGSAAAPPPTPPEGA